MGAARDVRRQLPAVLADAPPLPGEEARYAQVLAVLEAAKDDPTLKQAMTEGAGRPTRSSSSRCSSSATTASSSRTTGARSRTRPPSAPTTSPAPRSRSPTSSSTAPNETKYFYQDLDATGRGSTAQPLHRDLPEGRHAAGQRLLVADALQRAPFLRAERDQPLLARHQEQGPAAGADGSLTIYVQAESRRIGSARQLAAGAEGRLLALRPRLLAEGGSPGRLMDAAGGGAWAMSRLPKP